MMRRVYYNGRGIKKYKEGFILLMEYWDSIPDEEKPELHKN